jgi:hypothetical protein
VKFFIPHLVDDPVAAETEWSSYLAANSAPPESRRIYMMTYEHGGSRFEVTVGKPRREYVRRTGPRGGRIKDADFNHSGSETGTVVSGIVDARGDLIFVWSYGPPFGGWHNASLVGRSEIKELEYFDD